MIQFLAERFEFSPGDETVCIQVLDLSKGEVVDVLLDESETSVLLNGALEAPSYEDSLSRYKWAAHSNLDVKQIIERKLRCLDAIK